MFKSNVELLSDAKARREAQRLMDVILGKSKRSPEPVSKGTLRVIVRRRPSTAWFQLWDGYLVEAIDMAETYVPIGLELANEEEVRKTVEFCRKAAQARHLTFEVQNETKDPHEMFGIRPHELTTATIWR